MMGVRTFAILASASLLLALFSSQPVEGKKAKKKGKGAKGSSSQVITLDLDNYSTIVKKNKLLWLEFYAPWCGHCKQLAPKWDQLAEKLKGRAVVAKTDATEESEMAEEFGVTSYPTIFLFKDGDTRNPVKYEGTREVKDFMEFVDMIDRPTVTVFSKHTGEDGSEGFVQPTQEASVNVLGTFDAKKDAKSIKNFEKAAKALFGKYVFGRVAPDAEGLPKELQSSGVRVFTTTTKQPLANFEVLQKVTGVEKFQSWIDGASIPPPMGAATKTDLIRAQKTERPILQVFLNGSLPIQMETMLPVASAVHTKFSKKKLAVMLWKTEEVPEMVTQFELNLEAGLPKFFIGTKEGQKYIREGDDAQMNVESLSGFVSQFFAGKLEAVKKSQPATDAKTEGGVTTVIGSTFNKVVADNTAQDVLIEFYAPWCGHCKALEPEFAELGSQTEKVDTLVIGKIDATANAWEDTKTYEVGGYPTLFFIPAAKEGKERKPITYEGARKADAILEFIKKEATHPIP